MVVISGPSYIRKVLQFGYLQANTVLVRMKQLYCLVLPKLKVLAAPRQHHERLAVVPGGHG